MVMSRNAQIILVQEFDSSKFHSEPLLMRTHRWPTWAVLFVRVQRSLKLSFLIWYFLSGVLSIFFLAMEMIWQGTKIKKTNGASPRKRAEKVRSMQGPNQTFR